MIYLLVSITLFTGVSIWTVQQVGAMKHRTISQHVAKSLTTQIVFGIVGVIASLLASVSIFSWILPHHQADLISHTLFGIVTLFFFAAAIIPYIKGTWRGSIHNIAAWGMCFVIPVVMFSALLWQLNTPTRVIETILFITTCVLLILLATKKSLRAHFLALQSLYLGIFFVFLVILAY